MAKKIDRVLREILCRVYERNEPFMSQKSLAQACELSMDTVNRVVSKLNQFRAIEKKPFGFRVTQPKKVLTYWASTRNLAKDIAYATYSPDPVEKIEDEIPGSAVFTAFSGFKRRFKSPLHYDEVYVYAHPEEVKRRFQERLVERTNLFVLRPDPHLQKVSKEGAAPFAQIYVDLWQIGGPNADRFIIELDKAIELKPTEALKAIVEMARKNS